MRRARALALALTILLAGCPAASTDDATVTPAPVPTQPSPEPTAAFPNCGVPTASQPDETPTPVPQLHPAPAPVENGTVNVTALVDRHDRVLREHGYELQTGNLLVQSDPTGPALRVRARSSFSASRHYVVDGTRYSYEFRYGGQGRFDAVPYDADTFRGGFGASYSLTGSDWLSEALSVGTYRVDERRPDGWVVISGEVATASDDRRDTDDGRRVETGDGRDASAGEDPSVRSLDATVVVDRRGAVRSVDQRYEVVESEGEPRTVDRSFRVTAVGSATVERPRWVCVAEREGHVEVP